MIYLDEQLEGYKIGAGQVSYLLTLYYEPGSSQQDVATRLDVDKANAFRAVKKLRDWGYVERKPHPKDKRSYQLFLTDLGGQVLHTIVELLKSWHRTLFTGFTTKESDTARSLLRRMYKNALAVRREEEEE